MRAFAFLLVIACSGSSPPATPAPSGPPAPMISTPAATADVQVATVDGKPVYGSCVAIQAARGASKQEALQQCIDFELLAQHAAAYATDPEVILATRTALVSELVAREYESKYDRPADFGTYWDRSVQRNQRLIVHGEARASAYLRITLAKGASPEQEASARAIAEELATVLAGERGLMPHHLDELGKQIAGTRAKLDFAVVPAYLNEGGLDASYANALFAILEVGRTSPAVRTPWGWDVILFSEVIPPATPTPDELVAKALPDIKRAYFPVWAAQLAKSAGISYKVFDDNLPLLEDL